LSFAYGDGLLKGVVPFKRNAWYPVGRLKDALLGCYISSTPSQSCSNKREADLQGQGRGQGSVGLLLLDIPSRNRYQRNSPNLSRRFIRPLSDAAGPKLSTRPPRTCREPKGSSIGTFIWQLHSTRGTRLFVIGSRDQLLRATWTSFSNPRLEPPYEYCS